MNIDKKKGTVISLVFCLCLLFCITFLIESHNEVITGDEIVTYSMANNSDGGFVFSEGRVAGYLKEYVFENNIAGTVSNLISEAKDILENRRDARFFTYNPDPEVRYYSQDEMKDWMEKRDYEKFNIGTTWLHSLSDESNSFFFYSMMNIACSLLSPISGTKWSGFILNMLIYLLLLFQFYRLTQDMDVSPEQGMLMTLLLGVTTDVLNRICYIRAYLFAMVLAIMLVRMHCRLWKLTDTENDLKTCHFSAAIPLLLIAVFSHYINVLMIFCLAVVTIVSFYRHGQKESIIRYIFVVAVSLLLSVLIDPFSIAGLFIKFTETSSSTAVGLLEELSGYFMHSLLPGYLFTGLLIAFSIALYRKHEKADPVSNIERNLLVSLGLFSAVVIIGTKACRYMTILTPLYLLVILLLIRRVYLSSSMEKTAKQVLLGFTCILFAVLSIFHSYQSFDVMNGKYEKIRSAIQPYLNEDCVFLRTRRTGYEYVPDISNFNNCQVITLTTENWKDLVSDRILANNELTLFSVRSSEIAFPLEWFSENGYAVKQLYEDNEITIYHASKAV